MFRYNSDNKNLNCWLYNKISNIFSLLPENEQKCLTFLYYFTSIPVYSSPTLILIFSSFCRPWQPWFWTIPVTLSFNTHVLLLNYFYASWKQVQRDIGPTMPMVKTFSIQSTTAYSFLLSSKKLNAEKVLPNFFSRISFRNWRRCFNK